MRLLALLVPIFALLLSPLAFAQSSPKTGGTLRFMHREDLPQAFAIHETSTNSVTWPAMPCYSNLVIYDQSKPVERPETIVGELMPPDGPTCKAKR